MHFFKIIFVLLFLFCVPLFSQEASEIYLFDLEKMDNSYIISNPINISNSEGYDNQPSFTEDGLGVLFTSTRNGQTDIARYDILGKYRNWITNTEFNEYSPTPYPGKKKYFTCVRFEDDGSQLFYKYSFRKKQPIALISDIDIGYYVWLNKDMVITFVLGDVESLQVTNFKFYIRYPIQYNIGRSLNKIPVPLSLGDELISYISKSHEDSEIYAIDPRTSETKYLVDPIEGSEDLTWTRDGSMLMGNDDKIYKFTPESDRYWTNIKIESDLPINNITRLTVSPDGTKIAIVVKE